MSILKKKSNRTMHGLKYHPLYSRWDSMMQRCNNKNCTNYKDYGGRGIEVSEEFKDCKIYIKYIESLKGYKIDLDLQVDRINNNGNYERNNLKLSTQTEQKLNTRLRKDNIIGYKGISKAVNSKGKYRAYLYLNKEQISIGIYCSIEEALSARNKYILDNNLLHEVQSFLCPESNIK